MVKASNCPENHTHILSVGTSLVVVCVVWQVKVGRKVGVGSLNPTLFFSDLAASTIYIESYSKTSIR